MVNYYFFLATNRKIDRWFLCCRNMSMQTSLHSASINAILVSEGWSIYVGSFEKLFLHANAVIKKRRKIIYVTSNVNTSEKWIETKIAKIENYEDKLKAKLLKSLNNRRK